MQGIFIEGNTPVEYYFPLSNVQSFIKRKLSLQFDKLK
ncbi:hypothetical protein M211_0997 [Acinetobacter lactucae]|nr:hypothetical protein M211_0997 [Acinetobacter lactucae]